MSIVLASASMAVSTLNKIRHCLIRIFKNNPDSRPA
jgi:hypothetical protein